MKGTCFIIIIIIINEYLARFTFDEIYTERIYIYSIKSEMVFRITSPLLSSSTESCITRIKKLFCALFTKM